MNTQFKTQPAMLSELLDDLLALRSATLESAAHRLAQLGQHFDAEQISFSVQNLACYLAFREHDLRPLQDRLAHAGLSSLGRGESNIMANLEQVIRLLSMALQSHSPAVMYPYQGQLFDAGIQRLQHNALQLFGAHHDDRLVRIMVTLPSEAASDSQLVERLLGNHVECVRINCAHDDQQAWQKMVDHVRAAAEKRAQPCRILMDLAGKKIRTGHLLQARSTRLIKTLRNKHDLQKQPEVVILTRQDSPLVMTNQNAFPVSSKLYRELRIGDRIYFADSRGKKRYFEIIEKLPDGDWKCHCPRNSYVESGTEITLKRLDDKGKYKKVEDDHLGEFEGPPIMVRLHREDALVLAREPKLFSPPEMDEQDNELLPARISCSDPDIIDQLSIGQKLWFDDGKMGCLVERIDEEGAHLRVTDVGSKGYKLRPDKGLNFPDTILNLQPLTDKDMEDLDFVVKHADMIGYSFVQTSEDMDLLIEQLHQRNADQLPIIAKIETKLAVENLPHILLSCVDRHPLGIMIARGDLAIELGSIRMAEIQEEMLWICEAAHVPVIWATQVLESLTKKGLTSRPEITDAAMSVRAECVMLNKGPYIEDAINVLANILSQMEAHQHKKISRLRKLHW